MTAPTQRASDPAHETRKLLCCLSGLALIFAVRAWQSGASLLDVAAIELFVAGWILLPGWAFYARRRGADEDGLFLLGMALACGFALEALAFMLLKALGLQGFIVLWPLVALPAVVRRLRAGRGAAGAHPALPGLVHVLLLFALLCFVAARTELRPADAWFPRDAPDQFFHLGNAVELAYHWPLRDARVATHTLNYHFLCYALATGTQQVFGVGLPEMMLRAGSLLAPLLLSLQVWNAARSLCRSTTAGLVALLLLFVGSNITPAAAEFGPGAAMLFNVAPSMEGAIYLSRPSPAGMLLFVSLVPLVGRYLARGEGLLCACLLTCALSGMKGSIAPVLVAGLALDALVRVILRHPAARRSLIQLGALTLCCSVFVVWLSLGGGSFAGAMFRFAPLTVIETSGMYLRTLALNGWVRESEPRWLVWAILPCWVALEFGPPLLAGVLRLVRERARELEHLWLWGVLIAGCALAFGLGAPANNQLFFLHPGQLGLALLAAGVIAAPFRFARPGDRWRALAWLLLAAPWLCGGVLRLCKSLNDEAEARRIAATSYGPELEALRWIRQHTQRDALVVAHSNLLYVSALAERRCFHESLLFVPETSVLRWKMTERGWRLQSNPGWPEVDPDRLRERLVAGEPGVRAELARRVGGASAVYLLFEPGGAPPQAQLESHSERVFANAGFHVWRVND